MPRSDTSLAPFLAVVLAMAAWTAAAAAERGPDYSTAVRPLLRKHCVHCHGALRQEGGLRVDTGAALRAGGDSGAAVVPGKPAASAVVERITETDPALRMPQESKPLSRDEVAVLMAWIEAGATSPADERPDRSPDEHWAYRPPGQPTPPQLADGAGGNPIDAFVNARQRQLGLRPLGPAPPEVLLRRVYLDLVGYPPPPGQLDQFLRAAGSDRAYQEVVDRLLASPDYGQRWGRHWMDVWRYSDWYGRRGSNEIRYAQRHIWRWRDWIIRSLNEDKGYDQMLVEMLAADESSPDDPDALAATGYLGRSWYKFDRDAWLFDTVEHAGRALMAVTVRCARCHDHKYDPISQQDYYRFRAIFEPHGFRTQALDAGAAVEVDNGQEKVLSDGLSRAFDEKPDAQTFLYHRGDPRSPGDQPLAPGVPSSLGGQLQVEPIALPPESYLEELSPTGEAVVRERARKRIEEATKQLAQRRAELVELESRLAALTAHEAQVEKQQGDGQPAAAFIDDEFESLDANRWKIVSGDWSVSDGRLIQSRVTSFATLVSTEDHPRDFAVSVRYRKLQPGTYRSVGFSFDFIDNGRTSQDVYTARSDQRATGSVQAFHRKDGKQVYPPAGIRDADLEVGRWIDLQFTVRGDQLSIDVDGQRKLDYTLPLERASGKFSIWVHQGAAEFDRLRVAALAETRESLELAVSAAEHAVQQANKQQKLAEARQRFELERIEAERSRLSAGDPAGKPGSELAVTCHRSELTIARVEAELALLQAQRRDALEGSAESQAALESATAAVVAAEQAVERADGNYTPLTPQQPTTSSGRRLSLARWLADADHPRTSRVAVNHIWLRHFGEALVPSVDNFGLSGDDPSHPELLDWLARRLSGEGWRMKQLHRQIVMSQAYRRASAPTTNERSTAAENTRIDPDNRYLWRANSRRMEAEAVRDSLLAVAGQLDNSLGGPDIEETRGQTSRRRSLYFRTTPDNQMEMLTLFDQASPVECYRRRTSVIPQQALALANGPLALDVSRQLAAKLTESLGPEADRDAAFVDAGFRRILSRRPTAEERDDCLAYLRSAAELLDDTTRLQAFPKAPRAARVAPAADPRQRARENLIHVLLNHNEFVTIR